MDLQQIVEDALKAPGGPFAQEMQNLARQAVNGLRVDTPVDTGFAAASWDNQAAISPDGYPAAELTAAGYVEHVDSWSHPGYIEESLKRSIGN